MRVDISRHQLFKWLKKYIKIKPICLRYIINFIQFGIISYSTKIVAITTNKWCYKNGMDLSFEKNKAMLILSNATESRLGEDEIDLDLNHDGTQIQNTKQENLLDVIIDNN